MKPHDYTPKIIFEEMLWRTLFSARHFLVSVVAKQLSLPSRRPNRLFVPPPALAAAARSAASNLGAWADIMHMVVTEKHDPNPKKRRPSERPFGHPFGQPYGRAIWPGHMAGPYGRAIWPGRWPAFLRVGVMIFSYQNN